jgi:serine/threonine protein kinase
VASRFLISVFPKKSKIVCCFVLFDIRMLTGSIDLLTGSRAHRPSLQGSVFWMAPEVVKQTAYTRKADIWSVGCLVVEMLTGEHPWAQLSQMQAIFKVRQTRHIIRLAAVCALHRD